MNPNIVNAILVLIKELDEKETSLLLDMMYEHVCMHCGAHDPNCQCWNDE